MAARQVIRELVTLWGFDIDQQPLKEVDAGINVIKQSLKGLAVAVAGSAAAVGFLLNEAGEDEQTRIAFETMLGSAEAMEQKLRELDDFAKRTPFTLKGIKSSSKQLLAMKIHADDLVPTLKFLGDVSAGLSVPLSRLALNFGQVRSQNRLMGRELKDFLVAGVPLLDELAKNLGKSTAEIQKMVSQGKISFKETEKAFISMTTGSGLFANLMDKQSKSFFGIMSNIQDVVQLLARDLGNELLPEAKKIVGEVLNFFNANEDLIRQNLGEFVRNLAEFLGDLFDIIKTGFRAVSALAKVFGGWNKTLKLTMFLISGIIGTGFILGIGLITKAVWGTVFAWTASNVAMLVQLNTMRKMMGLGPAIVKFFRIMGNSALIAQAKLMAIPLAYGAIALAIALIAEDIFAFTEGRDSVFGRMIDGMDAIFENLQNKFENWGAFLQLFLAGILTPVRLIVNGFKAIGFGIDVLTGKKSLLEGFEGGINSILGSFNIFDAALTARGMFGLSEQAGKIGGAIEGGSSSALKGLGGNPFKQGANQSAVTVTAKNEITLNVDGMDAETAKQVVTENFVEQLDIMLRGAVNEGASLIQR